VFRFEVPQRAIQGVPRRATSQQICQIGTRNANRQMMDLYDDGFERLSIAWIGDTFSATATIMTTYRDFYRVDCATDALANLERSIFEGIASVPYLYAHGTALEHRIEFFAAARRGPLVPRKAKHICRLEQDDSEGSRATCRTWPGDREKD
jgi:hypothetical protein